MNHNKKLQILKPFRFMVKKNQNWLENFITEHCEHYLVLCVELPFRDTDWDDWYEKRNASNESIFFVVVQGTVWHNLLENVEEVEMYRQGFEFDLEVVNLWQQLNNSFSSPEFVVFSSCNVQPFTFAKYSSRTPLSAEGTKDLFLLLIMRRQDWKIINRRNKLDNL